MILRLKSESSDMLKSWWVWTPEWTEWTACEEVSEIKKSLSNTNPEPSFLPPPFPEDKTEQEINFITQISGFQMKTTGPYEEKRKYKRYSLRLKIIIRNQNLTFRSFSRDISLGGIALEHIVPEELLGSESQIYLSSLDGKDSILFNIHLTESKERIRFVFSNKEEIFAKKLEQWISSVEKTDRFQLAS